MKDVFVARGIGLVAALTAFGALLSGLAAMQFAPFLEQEGPKRPPIVVLQLKPEPPPVVPRQRVLKAPQRPTAMIAITPPAPVDITPSPEPTPMASIAAEPAAAPAGPPMIEIARPLGVPPRPTYPERALQREKEGDVIIRLIVGIDGDVTAATILAESPIGFGFGPAALATVRRTKFEPKRIDGAATLGEFTYTLRFRLD